MTGAARVRVVVVGNCQARPIARLLESCGLNIEVTAVAIVHLLDDARHEEYREHLETADFIVAQLVADDYPCRFVSTSALAASYPEKLLGIVNLYHTAYTPDWFYVRRPGRAGVLKGPMGDYQNRTAFETWAAGGSVAEAVRLMEDVEHNVERFGGAAERSLAELRGREAAAHVRISDVIERSQFERRLLFTFNHPSMFLLRAMLERVIERMDIGEPRWAEPEASREWLDKFVPIANPSASCRSPGDALRAPLHKGVEVSGVDGWAVSTGATRAYTTRELVETSYAVFERNRARR